MLFKERLKKYLIANPKRAIWIISNLSVFYWKNLEEKIALESFHKTARNIPAYKDFLLKEGIKHPEKIQTIEDFKKYVPIIQKENYINQYPLSLRQKKSSVAFTLSTSGGTTGKPIIQAHTCTEFDPLPTQIYLEYLLNLSQKKTLYINAFALGSWYGGIASTLLSYSIVKKKGYHVTISLCGLEPEIILHIIEKIGKEYELIVISSYPSFFKLLLQEAKTRDLHINEYHIIPLCSGELFIWNFKQFLAEKFSLNILYEIIDMYAATDVGIIGVSTPLSNLIQQKIINGEIPVLSLKKSPFSLFQHNPLFGYIEEINNEVVITRNYDLVEVPLIRYRIKDKGGIIPFEEVYNKNLEIELNQRGFVKKPIKWPFLFVQGRADYAVIFLGANIYPHQIKEILEKERDNLFNNFKIGVENGDKPRFVVHLELLPNVSVNQLNMKEIQTKYHSIILRGLLKDLDFRDAYQKAPQFLDPLIKIYPFGQGPFSEKIKTKPKYIIK